MDTEEELKENNKTRLWKLIITLLIAVIPLTISVFASPNPSEFFDGYMWGWGSMLAVAIVNHRFFGELFRT
jgi:hypothetical protein